MGRVTGSVGSVLDRPIVAKETVAHTLCPTRMPKTILQGSLPHRLRSLATLLGTTAAVLSRRCIGRPLVPQWSVAFEIGTLFQRRQFIHALALPDVADSRAYFDSL